MWMNGRQVVNLARKVCGSMYWMAIYSENGTSMSISCWAQCITHQKSMFERLIKTVLFNQRRASCWDGTQTQVILYTTTPPKTLLYLQCRLITSIISHSHWGTKLFHLTTSRFLWTCFPMKPIAYYLVKHQKFVRVLARFNKDTFLHMSLRNM